MIVKLTNEHTKRTLLFLLEICLSLLLCEGELGQYLVIASSLVLLSSCETIRRDSPSAQGDTTAPILSVSLENGSSLRALYTEAVSGNGRVTGPIALATGEVPARALRFRVDLGPDTEVVLLLAAVDNESGVARMEWPVTIGISCPREGADWITFSHTYFSQIPNNDSAPTRAEARLRFSKRAAWAATGCTADVTGSENSLHFEVSYALRAQNNSPAAMSSEMSGRFND